jgi:alkylated DNA repair dioxygenase AlkB
VSASAGFQRIELPDADVSLWEGFLGAEEARGRLVRLVADLPWRQDHIRLYGHTHPVPRLHQWFGDPGRVYTWSGIRMEPQPWPVELADLRDRVGEACGAHFHSVLANLYRDGRDRVAWHADDEPELGPEPVIASLSLGAPRTFRLKHRLRDDLPVAAIELRPGSLLVMRGPTQRCWVHEIPRRKNVSEPRVNLTYRALAPG